MTNEIKSAFTSVLKKCTVSSDEEHNCKICHNIYENVYQADCGCRLCFKCFDNYKNLSNEKCVICGEICDLNVKIKDKAFQKIIDNLSTKCNKCSWKGVLKEFEKHFYDNHDKICEYKDIGCNFEHSDPSSNSHETAFMSHLDIVHKNIDTRVKKLEQNSDKLKNIEIIRTETKQISQINEDISNQENKQKFEQIEKNLSSLKHNINEHSKRHDNIKEGLESQNKKKNELKEKLEALKKDAELIVASNVTLNETLSIMETTNYNGKLIWKITNVDEKRKDAVSRKVNFFDSPCFYTNKFGYKLCARIYLNGDGKGFGRYLSLFIIVMQSEHDFLVKWPLKCEVKFILIDQQQNDSKEDIIDSFHSDENLVSFTRPKSSMNPPSGFSLFCKLDKIFSKDNCYVFDNCMFIKIIVNIQDN